MEHQEDFWRIHELFHGFGEQQWIDEQVSSSPSLANKMSQLQSTIFQIAAQDSVAAELLVDQLLLMTRNMLNSPSRTSSMEQQEISSSDEVFADFGIDLGVYLAGAKPEFNEENHLNDHYLLDNDVHHQQQQQELHGNSPDEEDGEAGMGSYDLIELDAMAILAEHTHFCEICGKGFKRDANLRMHMRGHGDEYKTLAALARPPPPPPLPEDSSYERRRRYSCPYDGCRRNRKHGKFLPLKTLLCVKNHYRRSHCPKLLTCTKCKAKRFSVTADLRTHEKHCGREKWQCSCGTTFSRKDKLLGHLSLFIGHIPVFRH